MQGKTKNYKFVAKFITECSSEGKSSTNQIIEAANTRICEIDEILRKIHLLKEERSNLTDVVFVLKNG